MPQPDVERWQRIYSYLLDIERHWTEQVQNQQQRISTILTVNGFLLGFLGSVGLSDALFVDNLASTLFIAALVVLTIALALGLWALRPRIAIATLFDSAEALKSADDPSEGAAIRARCESLVNSLTEGEHEIVMKQRRNLMEKQLILLLLGLLLLAMAWITFQT